MDVKQEHMGHDDIWDDSALIRSWNDALDEYKKYHSIHASGGLIKLEDADLDEEKPQPESRTEAKVETQVGSQPSDRPPGSEGKTQPSDDARLGLQNHGEGSMAAPIAPQGLLNSVQDEGLKRLLMSWYYAGYYTGLYEGQQKK